MDRRTREHRVRLAAIAVAVVAGAAYLAARPPSDPLYDAVTGATIVLIAALADALRHWHGLSGEK